MAWQRIIRSSLFLVFAQAVVAQDLYLRAERVDPEQRIARRSSAERELDARATYWVVGFEAQQALAVRRGIEAIGARVESYIPDSAYRVARGSASLSTLERLPGVRYVLRWRPEWKRDPALVAPSGQPIAVDVYGYVDAPAADLEFAVKKVAQDAEILAIARGRLPRVRLRLADADTLGRLQALDQVSLVGPAARPETHNADSAGVLQGGALGATSIWQRGITGNGQIVAVADSGLDANEPWFTRYNPGTGALVFVTPAQTTLPPMPGSLVSNAKVIGNWVQPGAVAYETDQPCGTVPASQHGTHVSGSVAGDAGATAVPSAANAGAGDGLAPNARILFQDIGADCLVVDDYAATLMQAWNAGARIHTNSWGAINSYAYLAQDHDADDSMWRLESLLVLASAGNRSDAIAAIGSPGNAKNVLTVGALEHGDSTIVAEYSSIGPAGGVRDKPDLVAPGTDIVSASGDILSLGAEEPAAETKTMSGTSMATPAVAASAALMRQYFSEGFYPTGAKLADNRWNPLAATLKAALINSSDELINTFIGETRLPSWLTGWGRLHLDRDLYFPGDARRQRLFERRHLHGLATGEQHEYQFDVSADSESLRVTLAWLDPAAVPGVEFAMVNNLDLEVLAPNGDLFRGNALGDPNCASTSCYIPGPCELPSCRPYVRLISIPEIGPADTRNSIEAVRILHPEVGTWTLRIRGTSVPGNGAAGSDRQGYGVAVAGALGVPQQAGPAPALNLDGNDSVGVALSFAAGGASRYQLYRAAASCENAAMGDFHLVDERASAQFLDAGTLGGERYAYRARLVSNNTESRFGPCLEVVSNDDCLVAPEFAPEAPAVDSGNSSCAIALSWADATPVCRQSIATTYRIERSDEPSFALPLELAANHPESNFVDSSVLPGRPYFYRVFARDSLGNESPPSAVRNATAVGEGGPAGLGFVDNIDDASHADLHDPWQIVSGGASDGAYAYKTASLGQNYARRTCASIDLPPLVIPSQARFAFDTRYQLETSWDGVVVEFSTDGASWQTLNLDEGYPGTFALTQDPPINACGYSEAQDAFTGSQASWQRYHANLESLAGQTVWLRFRLSTDPAAEFDGFWLDAMAIESPGGVFPVDLLHRSGFDIDDAAAVGRTCAP